MKRALETGAQGLAGTRAYAAIAGLAVEVGKLAVEEIRVAAGVVQEEKELAPVEGRDPIGQRRRAGMELVHGDPVHECVLACHRTRAGLSRGRQSCQRRQETET